jgi:hypothetical protein
MSGRTAKRLRSYLRAIPLEMRVPGVVSRLRRGWAALAGAVRGQVSALSGRRTSEAARRVLEAGRPYFQAPVRERKRRTVRVYGSGLLKPFPRAGGPAHHPGRAWMRALRARRAAGGRS